MSDSRPFRAKWRWRALLVAGVVASLVIATIAQQRRTLHSSHVIPIATDSGYVGSEQCALCHREQYESWHRSYHRTMTQVASLEAIQPNVERLTLRTEESEYRLQHRDDQVWVNMPDPEWQLQQLHSRQFHERTIRQLPRIERPIVMTTGSHHQQCFWVQGKRSGELWMIPWAYHIADRKWVPMESNFIRPPDEGPIVARWNDNCIACHSVAPIAGLDPKSGRTNSHVSELGIGCEACHGPAGSHIEHHRGELADETIIRPDRLSSERASEICGQCHSLSLEKDFDDWANHGSRYRPGDDLHDTRMILSLDSPSTHPELTQFALKNESRLLQNAFWSDGTIRAPGRDFNGLERSACYRAGLSCLSCHSMHHYQSPDDQLRQEVQMERVCLACHAMDEDQLKMHTHHAAQSQGSDCLNCHMPHTTFGLQKGIRSHRITIPRVTQQGVKERPNACNLCHFDQTLDWTAQQLHDWYGHTLPELDRPSHSIAASLLWLYQGDAAQRALVAWHADWNPSKPFSEEWIRPHLLFLMDDPYAVVRSVATRSLRNTAGLEGIQYDPLASQSTRAAQQKIIQRDMLKPAAPLRGIDRLMLDNDGDLNRVQADVLLRLRDNSPISVRE